MSIDKLNDKEYTLGVYGLPKIKNVARKINEIINYLNNLSTATIDAAETYTVTGTTQSILYTPIFIYGVYMNGQRLNLTTDYTIVGTTITFVNTLSTDTITIIYKY